MMPGFSSDNRRHSHTKSLNRRITVASPFLVFPKEREKREKGNLLRGVFHLFTEKIPATYLNCGILVFMLTW